MRDLTSRLRDIVRQDDAELAQVADVRARACRSRAIRKSVAARLEGKRDRAHRAARVSRSIACGTTITRTGAGVWRAIGWKSAAPLRLFDRRVGAPSTAGPTASCSSTSRPPASAAAPARSRFSWAAAGSRRGGFRVRQFFLSGPGGERAMLEALAHDLRRGQPRRHLQRPSFDVPLMETRWAFHRTSTPTDDLPHFDMLPPARRLWGRRT